MEHLITLAHAHARALDMGAGALAVFWIVRGYVRAHFHAAGYRRNSRPGWR